MMKRNIKTWGLMLMLFPIRKIKTFPKLTNLQANRRASVYLMTMIICQGLHINRRPPLLNQLQAAICSEVTYSTWTFRQLILFQLHKLSHLSRRTLLKAKEASRTINSPICHNSSNPQSQMWRNTSRTKKSRKSTGINLSRNIKQNSLPGLVVHPWRKTSGSCSAPWIRSYGRTTDGREWAWTRCRTLSRSRSITARLPCSAIQTRWVPEVEILIRYISPTCASLRSQKPTTSLRRMRAFSEMHKFNKLSIKVYILKLSRLLYYI